ncbi:MAG: thiamine phosphate synthase [Persicimonas sp.]
MTLPKLQIITNLEQATEATGSLQRTVKSALEAGARLIQLREKSLPDQDLLDLANTLVPLAHEHDAKLLINTHADVARQAGADGVHRPADGPSVDELRRHLDPRIDSQAIVGVSTHSLAEARAAAEQGADYITLSPIFESASKPGYGPALGLDALARVCGAVDIPVYALAGVTPARVAACLEAGAYGVAVMGGVMRAKEVGVVVEEYLGILGS